MPLPAHLADPPFPVDPGKYAAFLVAMFFMAISPGPANMFFVRTGLSGQAHRVFTGVLGVSGGTSVWFVASAFGLQAVMSAFPLAFRAIALLGGLYVIWLGFKTFRAALSIENEVVDEAMTRPAADKGSLATLREGFMVQLLNPKALLFFSAVLPPFVDTARPMPAQMMVFAATTLGMDVIAFTSYGLGAVRLARLLSNPRYKQRFDLGAGSILMLIGTGIAWHAILTLWAA
ncbi:MAG: LysE family translocator [Asticcacaulis sp.]